MDMIKQAGLTAQIELAIKVIDEKTAAEILSLKTTDCETGHVEADNLLLEILEAFGFEKTVNAFNEIDKWYS